MNKKSNKIIIILVLAIILGAGGYFGGLKLFDGNSEYDEPLSSMTTPTDANGNNLIGNKMENLHSGGLITQQDGAYFFADFDDGGTLHCLDQNGVQTKLTDFAVANLNIRGNILIFTDLSNSSYVDSLGQTRYINAAQHEDIWNVTGTTQGISYGGNLFSLAGVRSFGMGEIIVDEMILAKASEGTYQSLVFSENYLVMLPIRSKDYLLIAEKDNEIREIRITQDEAESIINFIIIEEKAFVQVINELSGEQYITKCDLPSGEIEGIVSGRSLTTWLDSPVFISTDDGLVYLWDVGNDDFAAISRLAPEKDLYTDVIFGMGGAIVGPVFFAKNANNARKKIFLIAVPVVSADNWRPSDYYSLADPVGITLENPAVTIYAVTPKSLAIYKPAPPATGEEINCGDNCECIERCDCGKDCECFHNSVVQEVDGQKRSSGSGRPIIPESEKPEIPPESSSDDDNGGTFDGTTGGTPGGRPGEQDKSLESLFLEAWEIYDGTTGGQPWLPRTPDSQESDLTPGGDTGDLDLKVDPPETGDWYPGEPPEESIGTMPPSIIQLDDKTKGARSLIPKNLEEYNLFNQRNGGNPPPMDKSDIGALVSSSRITLSGTTTIRYDYKLDKPTFIKEYKETRNYTDEMINALMAFGLAGGFVGDEQATSIRLVFPDNSILGTMTPTPEELDIKQGPMHTEGENKYYLTSTNENYWVVDYWNTREGYLTMFHVRNYFQIGVCLSFGRDANGNTVIHGWYVHTDSALTRVFGEINLTVAERINYREQDLSAYNGIWYKEAIPDDYSGKDQITMEIWDGVVSKYYVNGIADPTMTGRLYTESPGVTYLYMIKDEGDIHYFGMTNFESPDELRISVHTFHKQ